MLSVSRLYPSIYSRLPVGVAGFTLFEVAIALAIASFGVVSVLVRARAKVDTFVGVLRVAPW